MDEMTEVVKPEMDDLQDDKYLEKHEMVQLALNHKEQKVIELQSKLEQKDIIILTLKKEALAYQSQLLENEIGKKKEAISKNTSKLVELRQEHRNFTKDIAEKYELDEKWGFDPETGKIQL